MSELISDDYDIDDEQEVILSEDPTPEVEEESDSAPDTGEDQEKHVQFTPEQQEIFNKTVGVKVAEKKAIELEKRELERQLEEFRSRAPAQQKPVVPDLPDPFAFSDDEYRQRIQQREQALIEQVQYDARQRAIEDNRRQMAYQEQMKQQEELNGQIKSYSDKATKFGIKPEELQVAGNTVAQFGMDDTLVSYILADDHGPLITKYLANNLTDLDELSRMPPTLAAVKIATTIKQKAASLKPKVNNAPDPLDAPRGAGSAPKPKGPQGAIFE